MSVNFDNWVLPPEASGLDRATLAFWRFWEGWLRSVLSLARSVGFGTAMLAAVAWFLFDGAAAGVLGVVVSGAVVISFVGGMRSAGRAKREKRATSFGRVLVAVMLGLPLGLFLLSFAIFGMVAVMSFVVIPVINHPLLALAVIPTVVAFGYWVQRLRRRNEARYP